MEYPRVYDQDMRLLAILENASAVGYTLKNNDLSTAKLSLPTPDEKNAFMAAHNIVRIYDGEEEVGLFRIVGEPESSSALAGWTEYSLEHVIATLVDDVLFGYHEIGGTGIYTRDVAQYILARQETTRWQLGRCDFTDQYAYKFENANLLAALFSLGNVLTDEYQFTYDTTTTPWTVNIIRADAGAGCEIRYQRNMQEITRAMDASALVTRLYLLGYGEGVNQLNVKAVNGGLPYILADTAAVWGVKSSVFVDTTIENAASLLARGRAVLKELKNPYLAYKAAAVDLFRLTGLQWDRFLPGKLVHVRDEDKNIDFTARIVTKTKDDVYGDPGGVELEIANRVRDLADSVSRIAERQGIAELYSQGATNLYSQQYADNADGNHPAVMRFYVPHGCVRINSVRLSWSLGAFRAYETGAAAGGATTTTSGAGGATTITSAGGGATTVTTETTVHSVAGVTYGPKEPNGQISKTKVGGAITWAGDSRANTGTGGLHSHTIDSHNHQYLHWHTGPSHTHDLSTHRHDIGDHTHSIDSHRHDLNSHKHSLNGHRHSFSVDYVPFSDNTGGNSGDTGAASGSTGYSGKLYSNGATGNTGYSGTLTTESGGSGTTSFGKDGSGNAKNHTDGSGELTTSQQAGHTHGMDHTHDMDHVHSVEVSVTIPGQTISIPSHTHSVEIPSHSHSLTLADHTHAIVHGIYEGGTAQSVTIQVDGTAVPAGAVSVSEMDVAAWLSKDQAGKITRGTWHTIEIIPDALTRIEANLFVQAFVQSVGGGDY